jgi:arsenite methyltransferase
MSFLPRVRREDQGPAPPDVARARVLYQRHAVGYDASARRTMPLRRRTIRLLRLKPGQTVLDVACGTGLSFGLLREGVGETGRIIGVDLSPQMLEQARARCEQEGWRNVTLIESAMESVAIPGPLDAILFNFTHDVIQSPRALERIFAAARPGARIAAAGMKYAPWWLAPLNPWVRARARPYMTTFAGLEAPWRPLLGYLERFDWTSVHFTTGYVGHGVVGLRAIEGEPVGGRREPFSGSSL